LQPDKSKLLAAPQQRETCPSLHPDFVLHFELWALEL